MMTMKRCEISATCAQVSCQTPAKGHRYRYTTALSSAREAPKSMSQTPTGYMMMQHSQRLHDFTVEWKNEKTGLRAHCNMNAKRKTRYIQHIRCSVIPPGSFHLGVISCMPLAFEADGRETQRTAKLRVAHDSYALGIRQPSLLVFLHALCWRCISLLYPSVSFSICNVAAIITTALFIAPSIFTAIFCRVNLFAAFLLLALGSWPKLCC